VKKIERQGEFFTSLRGGGSESSCSWPGSDPINDWDGKKKLEMEGTIHLRR